MFKFSKDTKKIRIGGRGCQKTHRPSPSLLSFNAFLNPIKFLLYLSGIFCIFAS